MQAPKRVGTGSFASLAEASYYDAQIARIGAGLAPWFALSPWRGMGQYLARELGRLLGGLYRSAFCRALPAARGTPSA